MVVSRSPSQYQRAIVLDAVPACSKKQSLPQGIYNLNRQDENVRDRDVMQEQKIGN